MAIPWRQEVFRFLDLSPELRNEIYRYLLVEGDIAVRHRSGSEVHSSRVGYTIDEPTLLFACRQIRSEGLSIFYGDNTFTFEYFYQAQQFLASLAPAKLPLLRGVDIMYGGNLPSKLRFDILESVHRSARLAKTLFGKDGLKDGVLRCAVCLEDHGIAWVTLDNIDEFETSRRDGTQWHDRRPVVVRKTKADSLLA